MWDILQLDQTFHVSSGSLLTAVPSVCRDWQCQGRKTPRQAKRVDVYVAVQRYLFTGPTSSTLAQQTNNVVQRDTRFVINNSR